MITDDDDKFLQSFEQCSLGATCWTHAAHIRVGWLVIEKSDSFDESLDRIRVGIMRFNSTQNSIGYHETITVAFARLIDARRKTGDNWKTFSERNPELFEKRCLEKFYSPALLLSEVARNKFLSPDLCELPPASSTME